MTTPGSNGPDQQSGGAAAGWGQPAAGSPGGFPPPPPGSTPPPPPPGGFPQGQYQPQPGQAPYPPQGGAPYPPQSGAGAFGAPQKSGLPKWLIPVIAGVVLVGAALALFAFFGSGTPEVGDCLDSDSGNPEVVDCDDSAAVLRIIGEHDEELTSAEFYSDDSTCSAFPETEYQLWYGEVDESDAEGTIYCTQYVN
ncbi:MULTISPECIES: LppU/SCO3897 family protein [unclassified Blastococcus]